MAKDEAFRMLISLYKERLYWHIRKIVLNHEDADDVLQNTFIKVFRSINGFHGNSKLFTWLYRIATNESISFIHSKATRLNRDLETLQQTMVQQLETDVYFDGDEIQLKLQKAIIKLPERQQLVFRMRYFDNMKYEDIAEILEVSVGSLKASYHYAKKKIEAYLKQEALIGLNN